MKLNITMPNVLISLHSNEFQSVIILEKISCRCRQFKININSKNNYSKNILKILIRKY